VIEAVEKMVEGGGHETPDSEGVGVGAGVVCGGGVEMIGVVQFFGGS
jgi:hypothetical protein